MAQRIPNSTIVMLIKNNKVMIFPEEAKINTLSLAVSGLTIKEILDSSNRIFKEFGNYELMEGEDL